MSTLKSLRCIARQIFGFSAGVFVAACTAPLPRVSNSIIVPSPTISTVPNIQPLRQTPDAQQSPDATKSNLTPLPDFVINYKPQIVSLATRSSNIATISNTADWNLAFAATVQSNYGYLDSLRFTKKGTMPDELIIDTRFWYLRQVEQCCTVRDGTIRGGTTLGGTHPLTDGTIDFPGSPSKIYTAFTKDALVFGLLVKINKNRVISGMTLGFDIATNDFEVVFGMLDASKSHQYYKWPNMQYVGLPLSGELLSYEVATPSTPSVL